MGSGIGTDLPELAVRRKFCLFLCRNPDIGSGCFHIRELLMDFVYCMKKRKDVYGGETIIELIKRRDDRGQT